VAYSATLTPFSRVGDRVSGDIHYERSLIRMSADPKVPPKAPTGDKIKSDYSYATGANPHLTGDEGTPKVANYKFSYFEDDILKKQRLAILGNRQGFETSAGVREAPGRRADIISMNSEVDTQNAVSLRNVIKMMNDNFPAWENLHISACREIRTGSNIRGLRYTPHYSPDWKPKKPAEKPAQKPAQDRKRRSVEQNNAGNAQETDEISNLITLITINRRGGITETVQGAILTESGEYVELHPERGESLFIADYEKIFQSVLPAENESWYPFGVPNASAVNPGGDINLELNSIAEPAFEIIGNSSKFGLVRLVDQPRGDTWIVVPDGYEFDSKDVPIANRTAVAKPYTNFQVANVQRDVAGFRRLIFQQNADPISVFTVTRTGAGEADDCDATPIEPLMSRGNRGLPIDRVPGNDELCIFSGNSRLEIASRLAANAKYLAA